MNRATSIILPLLACLVASWGHADTANEDLEFYRSKVLPILREHCLECHSHAAGKARGGLVLDSHTSMLTGGETGPAIRPGDAESSLLIQAVLYESNSIEMPPSGKLDDAEIDVLVQWVRDGAPAPAASDVGANAMANNRATATAADSRRDAGDHWALQPLKAPSIPDWISDGSSAIDFLVDQPRTAAGLVPVDQASKQTTVLRLYSDLIGLPPSVDQLRSLLDDEGLSLSQLVDSLLEMPEFGERWGRHWLDVARYADSNGCSIESNNTYDNAWRYRDYVIASFNQDKPYDRFVVEQVAGDLLDHVSVTQRCDQLIATGFLLLGPKAFGTGSFDQLRLDVIDEQIDTVGKAMLGLSLGCARCHDHKFDPVSTEDYYALAGIFSSTSSVRKQKGWRQGKTWHRVELPVVDDAARQALQQAYEQTKKAADSGQLKEQAERKLKKAQEVMARVRSQTVDSRAIAAAEEALALAEREMTNASNMAKVLPVISPVPVAMAVAENESPVDEAVRIRGEAKTLGDIVPRGIPTFKADLTSSRFPIPNDQSGRLQLARWLTDVDQGAGELLARVAVNRIWAHLFVRPIVETPDNFGVTGQPPSNAKLLDYLADRFIRSGWSTKALIRDIVNSETYQLSSQGDSRNQAVDPDNVLLWRYQPKRIDVEVLRDSMLAVSGQLDRSRGGKTLQHLGLVSLGGDHLVLDAPSPYQRRSVYIPIYRDTIGLTEQVDDSMGMLATFDFADPNLMLGSRRQSVVPAQSLFLMNAGFVHQQASSLARRLLGDETLANDRSRIEYLYLSLFGRAADEWEIEQAVAYLNEFADITDAADANQHLTQPFENDRRVASWTSLCQAMFGSNEFLFLD